MNGSMTLDGIKLFILRKSAGSTGNTSNTFAFIDIENSCFKEETKQDLISELDDSGDLTPKEMLEKDILFIKIDQEFDKQEFVKTVLEYKYKINPSTLTRHKFIEIL